MDPEEKAGQDADIARFGDDETPDPAEPQSAEPTPKNDAAPED